MLVAPDKNKLGVRRKVDRRACEAGAVVSSGDRLLGGNVAAKVSDEIGGRR